MTKWRRREMKLLELNLRSRPRFRSRGERWKRFSIDSQSRKTSLPCVVCHCGAKVLALMKLMTSLNTPRKVSSNSWTPKSLLPHWYSRQAKDSLQFPPPNASIQTGKCLLSSKTPTTRMTMDKMSSLKTSKLFVRSREPVISCP